MLPHRTYIVVFGGIVVEAVIAKGVRLVARTLFKVEAVVFDVCVHSGLVHKPVVLFRAIAGIGNGNGRQVSVPVEKRVEE